MKVIGLIKEHTNNNNLLKWKAFSEFKQELHSHEEKSVIENYLKSGISISVSMFVLKSLIPNDDRVIGGLEYFTDGVWIWPSYLLFYFNNYNIEMDQLFIEHIFSFKYEFPEVGELEKNEGVKFLKKYIL